MANLVPKSFNRFQKNQFVQPSYVPYKKKYSDKIKVMNLKTAQSISQRCKMDGGLGMSKLMKNNPLVKMDKIVVA